MISTETKALHLFGIRHHGPGSARSLLAGLEQLEPDLVLVEGPPDADAMLDPVIHPDMAPPVALLIYRPDHPRQATFYPFAEFSPEWQAIRYALTRGVPVRFIDLPQAHRMALDSEEAEAESSSDDDQDDEQEHQENGSEEPAHAGEDSVEEDEAENSIRRDPIRWLAEAAGYSDGERWWEQMVEHRRRGTEIFAAIQEAMTALRKETGESDENEELKREAMREAWMRRSIRAARKDGFERIAVVCGAWHVPALAEMPSAAHDQSILKGLPKVKVECTWTPWTYGRLTQAGGYGAGIESPGWYDHLWQASGVAEDSAAISARWLTRAARLMREEDLDVSSAHVIEAVRLAETLAALGGRPLPGLDEMNDATRAVVAMGEDAPMRLIHRRLIVGERLGRIPPDVPLAPLARDLERQQKRLRLKPEAVDRTLDLDLRNETGLARSHLLHRLNLLSIPWGELGAVGSSARGTFHEIWKIQWVPEFAVALVEAGAWGNTVEQAATNFACDKAANAKDLGDLSRLADAVLLADLAEAVGPVMACLEAQSAVAGDVLQLMDVLPPLANVMRYGNVRRTDTSMVARIVESLVTRICISLPGACGSLDDDAAEQMFQKILAAQEAMGLLEDQALLESWRQTLSGLCDLENVHGLVLGRCCRVLLDAGVYDTAEAARRLGLALSLANEPTQAAAWMDGFLRESGMILLHDEALWRTIDEWVADLNGQTFTNLLPLLRRTFSTFSAPERRQIGERVKLGAITSRGPAASAQLNVERAEAVLPVLACLLGLESPEPRQETTEPSEDA